MFRQEKNFDSLNIYEGAIALFLPRHH